MAQVFIHGGYTDLSGVERMSIIDPSNGEEVDTVPASGTADVDRAVGSAYEAFPAWRDIPAAKRGEILGEAAEAVLAAREELAPLLTSEQGKPLREARLEIRRFVHTLGHYVGLARNIRGGYVPDLDEDTYGLIVRRPLGVIGAIVPWNFPTTLLGNKLGPHDRLRRRQPRQGGQRRERGAVLQLWPGVPGHKAPLRLRQSGR